MSEELPDSLVEAVNDLVEQVATHRHMYLWLRGSRHDVPWRDCEPCVEMARLIVQWARLEAGVLGSQP